jgi:hypothetical protein
LLLLLLLLLLVVMVLLWRRWSLLLLLLLWLVLLCFCNLCCISSTISICHICRKNAAQDTTSNARSFRIISRCCDQVHVGKSVHQQHPQPLPILQQGAAQTQAAVLKRSGTQASRCMW